MLRAMIQKAKYAKKMKCVQIVDTVLQMDMLITGIIVLFLLSEAPIFVWNSSLRVFSQLETKPKIRVKIENF